MDEELAATKLRFCRGIARLPLDALTFEHPLALKKHREVSQQNVARLEKIFQKTGCLRLQEEHIIDAVIEDDDFQVALSSCGMTGDELRKNKWPKHAPVLDLSNVKCLSGLHRIEAARQFLDENDKWWIVRLYSEKIPKPVLTRIIESYANEERPSDGEVFRKIRLYHRQNDEAGQNRWWACLKNSKPKDLNQLLKNKPLMKSFDTLIDMPGLWSKVKIGALKRLLVLKCDEEMILYLRHVKRAWEAILTCGATEVPFSSVDAITVQSLEMLAPNYSETDKNLVIDLMQSETIFSSQRDPNIRQTLTNNLCSFSGVIPSLWTFFEMLMYLEPMCEALKYLLGSSMKSTIRSSLMGCYKRPEKSVVQISEMEDVEIKKPLNEEEAKAIAYAELWIYSGRHVDELSSSWTPKKELKDAKPQVKGPNPIVRQQLARLAMSRGFGMIPHARVLAEKEMEFQSQLAEEYIRKANPMCPRFDSSYIEKVLQACNSVESIHESKEHNADAEELNLERRSGRPFENDFLIDKHTLFFPRLFNARPCNNASLALMRRDIFRCIFGHFEYQDTDFGQPMTTWKKTGITDEAMDVDDFFDETDSTNRGRLEQLENENRDLRSQLSVQQEQCHLLTQRGALADTERGNLQSEIARLQALLSQLQESIRTEEGKLRDEQAIKLAYETECENLRNQLDEARIQAKASSTMLSEDIQVLQEHPIAEDIATVPEVDLFDDIDSDLVADNYQIWEKRPTEKDFFEIFITNRNSADGTLIGTKYTLRESTSDIVISWIKDHLSLAEEQLGKGNCTVMNVMGKVLSSNEPDWLFQSCKPNNTLLIGPSTVLNDHFSKSSITQEIAQQQIETVLTVPEAAAIASKKRQHTRQDEDEEDIDSYTTRDKDNRIITRKNGRITRKKSLHQREHFAGQE